MSKWPLLGGAEDAYQFALDMQHELHDAIEYWGGQAGPSAALLTELLRKFSAELEQKGAILARNRFIIDIRQ